MSSTTFSLDQKKKKRYEVNSTYGHSIFDTDTYLYTDLKQYTSGGGERGDGQAFKNCWHGYLGADIFIIPLKIKQRNSLGMCSMPTLTISFVLLCNFQSLLLMWVELCAPKTRLQSQSPAPQNITLFGNRSLQLHYSELESGQVNRVGREERMERDTKRRQPTCPYKLRTVTWTDLPLKAKVVNLANTQILDIQPLGHKAINLFNPVCATVLWAALAN